jgi:hypothetical protein
MRAKILRQAGGAQNRDSVCLVCGAGKGGSDEGRRRLKTLLEVELGCGYKAEMYMCSYCYGKDSEFRGGSIEIPDVEHFHIQGSQHKTWFDFGDIVNWLKEWTRTPIPEQTGPGMWTVTTPPLQVMFFRCKGQASAR